MATNYTNTLAGMLFLNDQNLADIFPSEVLDGADVVKAAIAIPSSSGGTQHKYIRQSYAAGVGFREMNTGVTNAASRFDDITDNLKYLDASFARDVAVARAYRNGVDAYIQRETGLALKAAMYAIELGIFGFGQATQFVGLPYRVEFADTDYNRIVSAGGAGGKWVWFLRWAEDGVALVAGNDGRVDMAFDANNIGQVTDAGGTNKYMAYLVSLGMWIGLQVGSTYDAARIANLDGTSDDLLTDDLMMEALSLFPAGHNPNMIVMNRTASLELQKSRTAVNPTGQPAPLPTMFEGIPIVISESLGVDEATVDATTTTSTTSSSV